MKVVVVGADPVGLFCGMSLVRRGHTVTVIDRDPPPTVDGTWQRRSVMQFRHPHFFRPIVCQTLLEYLPEVWEAVIAAGGLPVNNPGFPEDVYALQCRRSTFEHALWCVAASEPGLTLRTGSVQRVVVEVDHASGVLVDDATIDANVVIIAAGRATHLGDEYRASAEGGPCGSPIRRACTGQRLGWSHRRVRCPCPHATAVTRLPYSLRTTAPSPR